MNVSKPILFQDVRACVDAVIQKVGKAIVLGSPIGAGKPNHVLNEFYRRATEDPSLQLTIMTGLSVEKPKANSDMERRFLGPFVERVFRDYPDLDYVHAYLRNQLPPNIRVLEFYMLPGGFLNNPGAQRHYMSSNYTHVGRDMVLQGLNVFAQTIARRDVGGETTFSLGSNSDSLDLFPLLREQERQGRAIAVIGQVNEQMPFMLNDAEVAPDTFHMVVDDRKYDHALFGPPNMSTDITDYLIGLHASSLVCDGGTLQIGIGTLGNAIAYGCCLRHEDNTRYRATLDALGANERFGELIETVGGTGPLAQGLYGSSEMFADGFRQLYEHGILKRAVYDDEVIQALLNEGVITEDVTPETFDALRARGAFGSRLNEADFNWLQKYGIFRQSLQFADGAIRTDDGTHINPDLTDPTSAEQIRTACLGDRLSGGVVMHGGFFLGPQAMYESLRNMDDSEARRFCMTGIGFANQLYGHERLATLQRRHARFMNTTMMVTLTGAACSDGVESGQVVSGVGGQYNFVAMAHALEGARSVLMVRSTRSKKEHVTSNLVWNYGHLTIPRHLRDIVVTEYGIADLRGKQDQEVIAALLNIADSRFQPELLEQAKSAGKVAPDYQIPAQFRENTPERMEMALSEFRKSGLFPPFPFGSDFTPEEVVLGRALKALKARTASRVGLMKAIVSAVDAPSEIPEAALPYLERMGLDKPRGLKERMARKLVLSELIAAGVV